MEKNLYKLNCPYDKVSHTLKYFDKALYRIQGGIEWNKSDKFHQFICTGSRGIAESQKAWHTNTHLENFSGHHIRYMTLVKYILKKPYFETGFCHHYNASFMRKQKKSCLPIKDRQNMRFNCRSMNLSKSESAISIPVIIISVYTLPNQRNFTDNWFISEISLIYQRIYADYNQWSTYRWFRFREIEILFCVRIRLRVCVGSYDVILVNFSYDREGYVILYHKNNLVIHSCFSTIFNFCKKIIVPRRKEN